VIEKAFAALLLMAAVDPSAGQIRSEVRIRERSVVRVPVRPPAAAPALRWREHKGPRCVPLDDIAGAAVTQSGSVDMILRGGRRIRAELEDACPALDYYTGFYLRSSAQDRMICADRDAIHSRSGGECEIERFRTLEPRHKR
jgi:hypothetical protein